MPQKRRISKGYGLERITLMLPADLKARLDNDVEPGVKTFSDVVRERLRSSVDGDFKAVSSRAEALGLLVARLANELRAYAQPDDPELPMLLSGIEALFAEMTEGDALGAQRLSEGARARAAQFAGYLWLKLTNAHEPTYSDGVAQPIIDEQRELGAIYAALFPAHVEEAKAG